VIEFDAVAKRFPDGTTAVAELSLVAPDGQITVLVGPSGCGKTTTLRMVNRMVEPTSGRILVDGTDAATVDRSRLRLGIGYVIQNAGLFPHRTVLDNIATVPYLLGWGKKRARARAHELLDRVGLPQAFAGRYPAQLSGGQQQRIGVARALAADPPIMLMDEPFSAVDPIVRASLQDEFLRLQQEIGKTILFVTHDIDEAVKLGDLVAVLREGGHLEQLDPPARLLTAPKNEFVESFVGRDRGFRGLSFVSAQDLPVHPPLAVPLGASAADVRETAGRSGERWALVQDERRHPVGWVDVQRLAGDGSIDRDRVRPLGATFTADSSLRAALDAAITAPSGQAVRIDDDGGVVGVVSHADIARHIVGRRDSMEQTS
jgi:osmoprotectant transport system ATP-binding protein